MIANKLKVLILVISSFVTFWAAMDKSLLLLLAFAILVFGVSFFMPITGVSMWILPVPFVPLYMYHCGVSPFILVSPALLFGIAANFILRRDFCFKPAPFIFASMAISCVAFSTFLNGHVDDLRSFVSILHLVLVASTGCMAVLAVPKESWIVVLGVVLSATIASIYSIGHLDGFVWRLTLENGVRELANPVGMAIAVLFTLYLYYRFSEDFDCSKRGRRISISVLAAIASLIIVLLSTSSRGVIIALVLGAVSTSFIFLIRALYLKRFPREILALVFFACFLILCAPIVDLYISHGQINHRMAAAITSPGHNLRWTIWSTAISSLEGSAWLWGAGLGSFGDLSFEGNYPHSVYVGALVEIGILGTIGLMLPMGGALWHGLRNIGAPFVFLWAYSVVTFFTYGSIHSKWYYFSVVCLVSVSCMSTLAKSDTSI